MREIIIIFCVLTFFQFTFGQDIIQFKVSKPYCTFNFLETATNEQGTSSSLKDYIISNTTNDSIFAKLCVEFENLHLDYNYKHEDFPENRKQYRSTKDLMIIALVNSNSLEEFKSKSIGLLPNNEQQKLIIVLRQASQYFDKLIWNKFEEKLNFQKKALEVYSSKASEIFNTFSHFYNSSWTADIPFIVSLYPIPGKRGRTTATPHVNSLCVGVMTDETIHSERMGVVFHEMCHVLFDEQTKEFQHQIDKWFEDNKSPYKQNAYNFFDEALATALGNGWAYKNISGNIDTSEWYNNEYINGFAKALYPLVDDYLNKSKQIDKAFIDKSIEIFANKFPKSISDYSILISRISIYSDSETEAEREELMFFFSWKFRLSNVNSSSPILDEKSLELLRNSKQTQLVIITKNSKKIFKTLKNIFPQLSKIKLNKLKTNTILSFYDELNRPIIILYAIDRDKIKDLITQMRSRKYFDTKNIIQK